MANRKERRRARKTSPLRDYEVMIATAIGDGWADHSMPPPSAIDGWLNDLYEKHPTIPDDRAVVQIAQNSFGRFLLVADPVVKTITIEPMTAEQATDFEKRAEEFVLQKTTRYPTLENIWKVELDPRIKAGWDRGDPLMPSEIQVSARLASLMKWQQSNNVFAAVTHRAETDPEDYVRLYVMVHPEGKTIRVAALMTPEAEAVADAYMADESDGTVESIFILIDAETPPKFQAMQ